MVSAVIATAFAKETPEAAVTRLVGALLLEQNHESAAPRCRDTTIETMAPASHDPIVSLPTLAG